MYDLTITYEAKRDLDLLQSSKWKRINDFLVSLREDPYQSEPDQLPSDIYRKQIGDHKILYRVDENTRTVEILRIKTQIPRQDLLSLIGK